MNNKFKVKNKRLSKYLYSLGFNRECVLTNDCEYWYFNKSDAFQEALDFYFYMRKRTGDAKRQKDIQKKN